MHERFPEHDAAVSDWMAKHGWPVTVRHYDFDREVLAWRAGAAKPTITLRVSQRTCEDVPPHVLTAFFDAAKLANRLAHAPDQYIVVTHDPEGGGTAIRQRPLTS